MMATNPWTSLPPRARTLCTHATHAVSAMVLCLGLTTTAASAAGGDDPYLQAIERINNDEPITGCDTDDILWMNGQMIEEAELVYELVLGNSAQNNSARPLLVEWAMVGEAEVELTSLLSIGDDELAAGVFMTGFLVDEEELPWLDFEPTGAAIPFEPFALAIANEHLADWDTEESELQLMGLAVVQGIATGEASTLDDVWMLLVEWESGSVWMMPIGIGDRLVRDGDSQKITPSVGHLATEQPEEPVETISAIGIKETIGCALIAGSILAIVAQRIALRGCYETVNDRFDTCVDNCGSTPAAEFLAGCDDWDTFFPGTDCHNAWLENQECLNCCSTTRSTQRRRCRTSPLTYSPTLEIYAHCWGE